MALPPSASLSLAVPCTQTQKHWLEWCEELAEAQPGRQQLPALTAGRDSGSPENFDSVRPATASVPSATGLWRIRPRSKHRPAREQNR